MIDLILDTAPTGGRAWYQTLGSARAHDGEPWLGKPREAPRPTPAEAAALARTLAERLRHTGGEQALWTMRPPALTIRGHTDDAAGTAALTLTAPWSSFGANASDTAAADLAGLAGAGNEHGAARIETYLRKPDGGRWTPSRALLGPEDAIVPARAPVRATLRSRIVRLVGDLGMDAGQLHVQAPAAQAETLAALAGMAAQRFLLHGFFLDLVLIPDRDNRMAEHPTGAAWKGWASLPPAQRAEFAREEAAEAARASAAQGVGR